MEEMKIGLFGFGCVAQGFYEILQKQNLPVEISHIVVKHKNKKRPLAKKNFSFDPELILDDDEISVVVELIDNADEAYELVKSALSKGKHVITANKRMLAAHLPELRNLSQQANRIFLYEAAVCGGIPILRLLDQYYVSENISGFRGIVNGTSNYILTRMQEDDLHYAEALKEAQQLGFAESNPTLDVEGFDSVNKLVILAQHAFHFQIHPSQIRREGITGVTWKEIDKAGKDGKIIRLVARGEKRESGEFDFSVQPEFIGKEDPLYAIRNEFNAIVLQTENAGEQTLIGKGAGKLPTGSAVIADLQELLCQIPIAKFKKQQTIVFPRQEKQLTAAV